MINKSSFYYDDIQEELDFYKSDAYCNQKIADLEEISYTSNVYNQDKKTNATKNSQTTQRNIKEYSLKKIENATTIKDIQKVSILSKTKKSGEDCDISYKTIKSITENDNNEIMYINTSIHQYLLLLCKEMEYFHLY